MPRRFAGGAMRTNIDIGIGDALINKVMRAANVKTRKDAVHPALREFLKVEKRKNLFDLAGKIEFEDGFDYKAPRRTRTDVDRHGRPSPRSRLRMA